MLKDLGFGVVTLSSELISRELVRRYPSFAISPRVVDTALSVRHGGSVTVVALAVSRVASRSRHTVVGADWLAVRSVMRFGRNVVVLGVVLAATLISACSASSVERDLSAVVEDLEAPISLGAYTRQDGSIAIYVPACLRPAINVTVRGDVGETVWEIEADAGALLDSTADPVEYEEVVLGTTPKGYASVVSWGDMGEDSSGSVVATPLGRSYGKVEFDSDVLQKGQLIDGSGGLTTREILDDQCLD